MAKSSSTFVSPAVCTAVDDDREDRGLALQIVGRIVGREGHLDRRARRPPWRRPAGPRSRGSAGPSRARPHALALAALERLAVDLALEVHDDEVAGRGRMLGRRGIPALFWLGELLDLRVDRRFVGSTVSRSSLRSSIFGAGTSGSASTADLAPRRPCPARIVRRARPAAASPGGCSARPATAGRRPGPRCCSASPRSASPCILRIRFGGHLAGAEAGHAHLRRDPLHLLLDPRLDVLGGDGQHEGALQALVLRLDGLDHVFNSQTNSVAAGDCRCSRRLRTAAQEWCARRDSNPHILRYWNLNPARLPVPPRARGRPKGARPITGGGRLGNPIARSTAFSVPKESHRMQQLPAEPPTTPTPPTPEPSQPGQPTNAAARNPAAHARHRRPVADDAGHRPIARRRFRRSVRPCSRAEATIASKSGSAAS